MPIRGGRAYRQSSEYKAIILERDHHRCQVCGCALGQVCNLHYAPVTQLDVAHIVPWAETHDSTPSNMRAICHPCNKREGYHTERQPVFT